MYCPAGTIKDSLVLYVLSVPFIHADGSAFSSVIRCFYFMAFRDRVGQMKLYIYSSIFCYCWDIRLPRYFAMYALWIMYFPFVPMLDILFG